MEDKRFKTKQEFEEEFGKEFHKKVQYSWADDTAMDYLFGCVYKSKSENLPKQYTHFLAKGCSGWSVSEDMLTTAPHPYSKGNWVVKVAEGQHDKVQAKALACGFKWIAEEKDVWFDGFDQQYLVIFNGVMGQDNPPINQDRNIYPQYTKLTFDQFMDGDVPKLVHELWSDVSNKHGFEDLNKEEAVKDDKFFCIATRYEAGEYELIGSIIRINPYTKKLMGESFSLESCKNLVNSGYSLITFNQFKSKYPPEPKSLELFGYDVVQYNDRVKIYSQDIPIQDIKNSINLLDLYFGYASGIFRRKELNEVKEMLKQLK